MADDNDVAHDGDELDANEHSTPGSDDPDVDHDALGADGDEGDGTGPEMRDDGQDGEDEDDGSLDAGLFDRQVFSTSNLGVIGSLTLHHRLRDVHLLVDGDSAMRLLDIFRCNRRVGGPVGDRLDPYRDSARNGWLVVDLHDDPPMAMSWTPGLPSPRPRTAIDPTVPMD